MDAALDTQTYRFADFELDLGAHQLRLRGQAVRLERRPLELLVLLVTRHGLMVPREEIIERLWPAKVVIDFETGINTLVRKVRRALGDSHDNPAFIETVAGRGYRFIAPVTQSAPHASVTVSPLTAGTAADRPRRNRRTTAAMAVLAVAGLAIAIGAWRFFAVAPSQISIAVLPFDNLTNDDELNYLAAGLAEDTSASLAQIDLKNLRMIGSVSAGAIARSDQPLSQIGHELGADFLVASSLRAEKSKIRVTSQLVRVADNSQVWSASFDRELTSVLGLQSELSVAIAEQVRLRLSPEVRTTIARRQTHNPEAYDLYLQGRYQWSLLSPASSRRAVEFYEDAIARDPDYALAWAGIAQVLSTAPITGDADPAFVSARARDAIQRAVRYGADLSEVQYALGHYHYILDWDWPAAESALRKAVALDPNNALAYLFLGHVLAQSGQPVEARAMSRRARELDPMFSHTFALSSQIAFEARDYASALELARQAIAINPEAWVGYLQLGQVQAELGEYEDALASYDTSMLYSSGNSKSIAYHAFVLAKSGHANEALAVIAELQEAASKQYVPPYAVALIYAALSDNDAALDWLERAYTVRDVHLVFLPVDPRWDSLRDDPRFQSLLRRCRFCGNGSALVGGRCQTAEAADVADEGAAPVPGSFDGRQTVSSANIDGIWSVTATAIGGDGSVSGLVTFTGPADKTRQMGMCLVQRYDSGSDGVACISVDDCSSSPADLPEGGSRYCVASNYGETKSCHYRPGPRPDYCAGSPASPDLPEVPAGSYRIDVAAPPESQWRALACFNVCAHLPPAISEAATVH